MRYGMREEFFIERQGERFVLYAGLLEEAHARGLPGMETEPLLAPNAGDGEVALVKATARTEGTSLSVLGASRVTSRLTSYGGPRCERVDSVSLTEGGVRLSLSTSGASLDAGSTGETRYEKDLPLCRGEAMWVGVSAPLDTLECGLRGRAWWSGALGARVRRVLLSRTGRE